MLTASHLPYNANGLKFFVAAGGLDKPDIAELLQTAAAAAAEAGVNIGEPGLWGRTAGCVARVGGMTSLNRTLTNSSPGLSV